ncbi:MAG: DegT/DnrJ/EryC1/StrS family aminotransferase [bacterium]
MNQENIPFFDLKRQYNRLKDEIYPVIENVYANTAFTNGPFVHSFEQNFARYCGVQHAVAVNSGTSALTLALRVLDLEPGDEVILPASTFIATAWAPTYVNASLVFCDCDPNTWQISVEDLKKKITPKTKAILCVHLYGQPCDIDPIKQIAEEKNIALIEDAAQAHGAEYHQQKIGSIGDMGCFSFYPGKNLGTYGEGGMITTNNEEYASRMKKLRNHASETKYEHVEIGYNMRMGGLEGAILDIKMKYIEEWTARRRNIADKYRQNIHNEKIKWQENIENTSGVYHLFVITTKDRESFMEYMKSNNISTALHYPIPCHLQQAFKYLGYKKGDLPNAEFLAGHCVSLPMFPELTDQEVYQVIETINEY